MKYLHLAAHTDGTYIDPEAFQRDDPNLYDWNPFPAYCAVCNTRLTAFISRPHNKIYAITCTGCPQNDRVQPGANR